MAPRRRRSSTTASRSRPARKVAEALAQIPIIDLDADDPSPRPRGHARAHSPGPVSGDGHHHGPSAPLSLPPPSSEPVGGFGGTPSSPGAEINGREIIICWVDGRWYDAVVVRYYAQANEHKLVYREDDGVEVISLSHRKWRLLPRRPWLPPHAPGNLVLHGTVIEFTYPTDGLRYQAMIYDQNETGDRVRIVYIDEHSTDNLKGGGWDVITNSPCVDDAPFDARQGLVESRRLLELSKRYIHPSDL